jgi:uncharacterized repeat protein (TIGR03803 family)
MTPAGVKTILYSFQGGSDGVRPNGSLINVGSALYGTTMYGGRASYGTVFKVTKNGAETVLHAFAGGADGIYPNGSLIDVAGTFFGTTFGGGGSSSCGTYGGCGTVFQVTP